ncbi:MAG: signal peptidase I [Actinobacteria bacterium]|nr:signal peptidase I [Actinomycetota bacterium]
MRDVDPSGTGTSEPDDHSRLGPPPPPPPPPAAPPETPPEEPSEHPAKRKRPFWVELPLLVVIAFVVALIIKTFLLQAFYIPSVSMVSTLHVGDRVLVEKVSYRFHEPRRGDVVVFERDAAPGFESEDDGSFMTDVTDAFKGLFGFPTGGNEDFIKRVIAVEGDSIECRDGEVMVNGETIDEPYLDEGIVTSSFTKTVVPEGMIFVMGDNRMDSQDSRSYGPIQMEKVIGNAFVIVWPFSNLGGL